MVGAFIAADDILLVAVVTVVVLAVAAVAASAVAAPAVVVVAVTESCFDHVLYLNEIQLGSDSENL